MSTVDEIMAEDRVRMAHEGHSPQTDDHEMTFTEDDLLQGANDLDRLHPFDARRQGSWCDQAVPGVVVVTC